MIYGLWLESLPQLSAHMPNKTWLPTHVQLDWNKLKYAHVEKMIQSQIGALSTR